MEEKKKIAIDELVLRTPDGKVYDIPERGSLALLALGDIGVIAWRNKIQQLKNEKIQAVLDQRKNRKG